MPEKKNKDYIKKGLLQARVDQGEMVTIVNKAILYNKGNLSAFIREACLNYRPIVKGPKK